MSTAGAYALLPTLEPSLIRSTKTPTFARTWRRSVRLR
jgi:hypothetical protein